MKTGVLNLLLNERENVLFVEREVRGIIILKTVKGLDEVGNWEVKFLELKEKSQVMEILVKEFFISFNISEDFESEAVLAGGSSLRQLLVDFSITLDLSDKMV